VKYPTIILFGVLEITKKSGGKNEARLLKLIIALSQGSLHQPLTSWLIQYVEESSETIFIDLTEIKSKFQSDVLVEVPSSRTIGNISV
jgi:hypothetical protein